MLWKLEISSVGHIFELFDEDNNLIRIQNGSIYMDGHLYKTDKFNNICIPYPTKSDNKTQAILLATDNDITVDVLSHFNHKIENYKFDRTVVMKT